MLAEAKMHRGNAQPLSRLRRGDRGVIERIDPSDRRKLRKLMAMGVFPGAPVRVVQTFPAYVFCVGFTQVAVDREMAEYISVRPE